MSHKGRADSIDTKWLKGGLNGFVGLISDYFPTQMPRGNTDACKQQICIQTLYTCP